MTTLAADSIDQLSSAWYENGLREGDTVLLHSDITRTILRTWQLNRVRIQPAELLQSFLAVLGVEGTLVVPLFNFDFTRGVPFDLRSTPSQMGVLTEAARLHASCVRTGHPIYSFAVIGARASDFRGVDNYSAYGSDSPFAMIRNMHGKVAVLDLPDQHSLTFVHHVEEMYEVPYRYHKQFTAGYSDFSGRQELRTYGMFVRDLERHVMTRVQPLGELLWREGLYTGSPAGTGWGLRVVAADRLFERIARIIEMGQAAQYLYTTGSNAT